ncbi:MAG: hypothetical protein NVSMB33_04700 [Ktedonobacteraceae bacterium]
MSSKEMAAKEAAKAVKTASSANTTTTSADTMVSPTRANE